MTHHPEKGVSRCDGVIGGGTLGGEVLVRLAAFDYEAGVLRTLDTNDLVGFSPLRTEDFVCLVSFPVYDACSAGVGQTSPSMSIGSRPALRNELICTSSRLPDHGVSRVFDFTPVVDDFVGSLTLNPKTLVGLIALGYFRVVARAHASDLTTSAVARFGQSVANRGADYTAGGCTQWCARSSQQPFSS